GRSRRSPLFRATTAFRPGSLSPQALALAWLDWASHLAASPGKQAELARLALQQAGMLAHYAQQSLAATGWKALSANTADASTPDAPLPDRRFSDSLWQQYPYSVLQQSFLMQRSEEHTSELQSRENLVC